MDITQLFNKANKIPSLGCGGKSISYYLYGVAKSLDNDTAIIEIGPWLGSATAFLCMGILESGKNIQLHCFDKWIADETYRDRAKKYHRIDFEENENILPYFQKNIEPFGVEPVIHRNDLVDLKEWNGQKIEMAVYDIGCDMKAINNFMKVFPGSFIPYKTIILLMDYYFYERNDKKFKTQFLMMEKNKDVFKPLGKIGGSKTAVFEYLGGDINYLTEDDY